MLQGVVKHLNTTLFNGQEFVLQQDSATANKGKTIHVRLRGNLLAFISAENWPSASPVLKPLDCKHWGYFEGHGLLKASQQPGEPEEISFEGSSRHLSGGGVCCDSRVAGVSQGLF
jgi:hypothetical protein